MSEHYGIETKPLDPAIVKELQREADEQTAKPIYGGLIPPPEPGCFHEWKRIWLDNNISVSRCSKCFVLGLPK